jgi:hypothetical protein
MDCFTEKVFRSQESAPEPQVLAWGLPRQQMSKLQTGDKSPANSAMGRA